MEKNHKNAIDFHKDILESKYNYRCRKEYPLPRNNQIKQIDCACFHGEPTRPPIAMEFESSTNWNNPQIQSNAEDLKKFKEIFPNAKTFHKHVSETINFDAELSQTANPQNKFRHAFRRF